MKLLFSFLLSLSVFIAGTPKAEAVVALVIKNRTVRVVGGAVTAAGATGFTISAIVANITGSYTALAYMVMSVPVAAVGLVILDEKNADLRFTELSEEKGSELGLTTDELAVYNSEIEELNAVKETIESQVTEQTSQDEIDSLWSEYKESLSPETLKVAAKIVVGVFSK